MIIVTTPMCKKIVEIAGLKDFKVNKHPSEEDGDYAILLSESKVQMPSIPIKLNTFSQIKDSILKISNFFYENDLIDELITEVDINSIFKEYEKEGIEIFLDLPNDIEDNYYSKKIKSSKKVKVYSEFLKDIVLDIGCEIDNGDFEYVVFPDYLKSQVNEISNVDFICIEIPTHSNCSLDPIIRANERYSLLLNNL